MTNMEKEDEILATKIIVKAILKIRMKPYEFKKWFIGIVYGKERQRNYMMEFIEVFLTQKEDLIKEHIMTCPADRKHLWIAADEAILDYVSSLYEKVGIKIP